MPILKIHNFSCIKSAEIEVSKCTIIIGEQATGKSIITKLIYFFNDILFNDLVRETDIDNLDSFKAHISEEFRSWFPSSAWGKGKFSVEYHADPVWIRVEKKSSRSNSRKISISFSDFYEDLFHGYRSALVKARRELDAKRDEEDPVFLHFDILFAAEREFRSRVKREVGDEFPGWQLFIPAGRSFFTSLGKAISAFERSGMLDPITMRFGEHYLSAKQRKTGKAFFYPEPKIDLEMKSVMNKFFGGEIVYKKDDEFVSTSDGRLIPMGYLSSGQQELLPLWLSIEEAILRNSKGEYIIYIEEPEAHIFPSTQSLLIGYISSFLLRSRENARLVITTHSPYVLAKFNNLVKAGIVGGKRGKANKVSELINRSAWLRPKEVRAYSIEGGEVVDIMDSEFLINAEYLDRVSGEISEEYMRLVEIECE